MQNTTHSLFIWHHNWVEQWWRSPCHEHLGTLMKITAQIYPWGVLSDIDAATADCTAG